MKICVDARYLSASPSGIGRYSENLLRELREIDRMNQYVVFVHEGYRVPAPLPENFKYKSVPYPPVGWGTLLRMGSLIDAEKCDFVHVHGPVIPMRVRTPLIVTFMDWLAVDLPGYSGRGWPVGMLYEQFYIWHYPRTARRAKRILTISNYTREETIRHVPEAKDKCVAIPCGVEDFFKVRPSDREIGEVVEKHRLPDRYILYVGTARPNKQVPTLLRAFEAMRRSDRKLDEVKLILKLGDDRFFPTIPPLIHSFGLQDHVIIHKDLTDQELRVFYRRAAVVSMATTYEGFGFPVVEAMAQGTPVVVARHGSIIEIANDAALVVEPQNAKELAEAFSQLLRDRNLREVMSAKGTERVKAFSWRRAAEETLASYRGMAALKNRSD